MDLNFKNSFVRKAADGATTFIWHEPWCGDGSVPKEIFSRIYALEMDKDCKVKDRGKVVNETWIDDWAWLPLYRMLVCFSTMDSKNGFSLTMLPDALWWWDLDIQDWSSFQEWLSWFQSIRLPVMVKSLLEGVFAVAWWSIWRFRNRTD
ncbi:hypothetical protein Tco_0832594, partial [Tanacetum coccineum]